MCVCMCVCVYKRYMCVFTIPFGENGTHTLNMSIIMSTYILVSRMNNLGRWSRQKQVKQFSANTYLVPGHAWSSYT